MRADTTRWRRAEEWRCSQNVGLGRRFQFGRKTGITILEVLSPRSGGVGVISGTLCDDGTDDESDEGEHE